MGWAVQIERLKNVDVEGLESERLDLEDLDEGTRALVAYAAMLKGLERKGRKSAPGRPQYVSRFTVYAHVALKRGKLSYAIEEVAKELSISIRTSWRKFTAVQRARESGEWDPDADFAFKVGVDHRIGVFFKIAPRKKLGMGLILLFTSRHFGLPCDKCTHFKTFSCGLKCCVLPRLKGGQSRCCLEVNGHRIEDL